MARIAENAKHYIGTSGDAKPQPTDDERIAAGSTFYETDTGVIARWDGGGWTKPTDTTETVAAYMAAQLDVLRRIEELIQRAM